MSSARPLQPLKKEEHGLELVPRIQFPNWDALFGRLSWPSP